MKCPLWPLGGRIYLRIYITGSLHLGKERPHSLTLGPGLEAQPSFQRWQGLLETLRSEGAWLLGLRAHVGWHAHMAVP